MRIYYLVERPVPVVMSAASDRLLYAVSPYAGWTEIPLRIEAERIDGTLYSVDICTVHAPWGEEDESFLTDDERDDVRLRVIDPKAYYGELDA